MRSLSENEINRKAAIERKLDAALSGVENAQSAYNAEMQALWQKYMAPAFEQLNAALSDAEEFRAGVEERLQEFSDDQSDKWQDSDEGSEFSDWLSEWQNVSFDEVDVEEPEEFDFESVIEIDIDAFKHLPSNF